MRRFYAPPGDFAGGKITLGQEETRHLRDVLRLRAGDEARVFDGAGREFSCAIETISKKETILRVAGEVTPAAPRSNLELTLAVALLKGEKFDLVVQKAVELGVSRLVPLITARCDVKLKNSQDFAKRRERLERIALEACKQSGRADLMTVEDLSAHEKFIATAEGTRVLFAERNGGRFSALAPAARMTAAIGPEGGWEDSEIEAARAAGWEIVTLGGRILRAETAAIAVAALLEHRFGDFN
jgi:16S rRNA (uracil1498-N3)-methyltransferase